MLKSKTRFLVILLSLFNFYTPNLFAETSEFAAIGREYQLLRVDAEGFKKLSPTDQAFAYSIFRAGLPGRDTYFFLNHRFGPVMKDLFESILPSLLNSQSNLSISAEQRRKIKEYIAIFYINSGPYNYRTRTKYILELGDNPDSSRQIFQALLTSVASLEHWPASILKRRALALQTASSVLFDPTFEPIWFSKDQTTDFIAESHINFFDPGVTTADVTVQVDGKPVANAANRMVNSRIKKEGDEIVEQVFSVNHREETIAETGINSGQTFKREYGLFSDELKRSVAWLAQAKKLTPSPQQAQTIAEFIRFFTTGDEKAFWDANVSWVKDRAFHVDFTMGWVEQYLDPLSVKGAWQTTVAYIDPVLGKVLGELGKKKGYFEEKMPWPVAFKIPPADIRVPQPDVHMVVHASGQKLSSPVAGINLPNNQEFREKIGQKIMILLNHTTAADLALSQAFNNEFLIPEAVELYKTWSKEGRMLMVALHEIIGHGSGKIKEGFTIADLGTNYNALEENRADLCAIYHSTDPLAADLGLLTIPKEADRVEVLDQVQRYMLYRKINQAFLDLRTTTADQVNESHQQGDVMTLNWLRQGPTPLLEYFSKSSQPEVTKANIQWIVERFREEKLDPMKTFAVAIEENGGKHFVFVQDWPTAIKGAQLLLEILQVARGTGDRNLVDAVLEVYVKDAKILEEFFGPFAENNKRKGGFREELRQRAKNIDVKNFRVFVSPTMVPVTKNGARRIELQYPTSLDDFLTQQLNFSRLARELPTKG